jgi:hypothetical protein
MFRKNKRHLQPPLISSVSQLAAKHRQRLDDSWAGEFYRECFSRLREEPFAVLYADGPSRPNIPVNVLVGLETLKAGFGWSDEELYDHFTYDLQVRYALGLHELGEGDFELRTLYNFRQRLSHFNQAHAINLLTQAFTDITDQQLLALQIDTRQQRMDSTQVASNILDASRLQLLVEAMQRLWRALTQADQARYQADFAPYVKQSSGQYVYRVKGRPATGEHLQQIGRLLHRLLTELAPVYANEPVYAICQRFLTDNFHLQPADIQPKANSEISAGCLQSLDDLEASYRLKSGQGYKGYVANLTETCEPTNPVQLITSVQVAPNTTEDSTLLAEAVPALKARMALDVLHTDGAFASPAADAVLQAQHVTQVQTALRGPAPDPDHFGLAAYTFDQPADGVPQHMTCPAGQTGTLRWGREGSGLVADFDPAVCQTCVFHLTGRCRAKPGLRDRRFHLDFYLDEVRTAQRRQACQAQKLTGHNLRVAVEATMRVIKHPFPAGKLPVRGLFRVTCLLIGSALMVNVRNLHRYRQAQRPPSAQTDPADGSLELKNTTAEPSALSCWLVARRRLSHLFGSVHVQLARVSC